MKLGLLSDVHMRSADAEAVDRTLRRVVRHFDESYRPDRVVVLGDLIEEEATSEEDVANIRRVMGILGDLDCPVTYLAGNHDVENLSSAELEDVLDQPLWGRIGETDLLYLDSSAPQYPGARGEVSDEQLAFLDRTLDDLDDPMVFVHHPIHYHSLAENYWFEEYPERAFCGNKAELGEILDGRGVRAVFNGHIHETDYTNYRGVDHFTVNAFNKELPDVGVTGTYAEVTLDERLTVRIVEGERMERTFTLPGPASGP